MNTHVRIPVHVHVNQSYRLLACLIPRVSCHNTDDYYANPAYFEARNMPLPSYEAMNAKVHVLASENCTTLLAGPAAHGIPPLVRTDAT